MSEIHLDKLTKIFADGTVAVLDLDLEIQDGEFMVFVGPSGCGKTTALRMIAGLEDITRGTVSIGGRIVNDAAPKDRDVAMVFQNYALYPHLSVYDNMAFSLKMRKVNKAEIERRVHEAARILGIDQLLSRKPKNLSAGNGSGWRWDGLLCGNRWPSLWTSLSRTWTRSSELRTGRRSPASRTVSYTHLTL